jgi:hypothetical protein
MIKRIHFRTLNLRGTVSGGLRSEGGKPAPSKERYSISWKMHPSLKEGFDSLQKDMKILVKNGFTTMPPEMRAPLDFEFSRNKINMDLWSENLEGHHNNQRSQKEKYVIGFNPAEENIYFTSFHGRIDEHHKRTTKCLLIDFSRSGMDMVFDHKSPELDIKYAPKNFESAFPLKEIRFDWDLNKNDLPLGSFSIILNPNIAKILNDLPIKLPHIFFPV